LCTCETNETKKIILRWLKIIIHGDVSNNNMHVFC